MRRCAFLEMIDCVLTLLVGIVWHPHILNAMAAYFVSYKRKRMWKAELHRAHSCGFTCRGFETSASWDFILPPNACRVNEISSVLHKNSVYSKSVTVGSARVWFPLDKTVISKLKPVLLFSSLCSPNTIPSTWFVFEVKADSWKPQ